MSTYGLINEDSSDCSPKKMNTTCAKIFDVEGSSKVDMKFY